MKRKIIIGLICIILLFVGIGTIHALQQQQTYQGFTIVFNGETGKGFVYINNASSSTLITIYPSVDQAFVYSRDGQEVVNASAYADLVGSPNSNIVQSTVSLIKPVY